LKRRYLPARQAYAPRMWPLTVLAGLSVGLLTLTLNPPAWVVVALAVTIGGGAPFIRVALWKRRHPLISPEDYLQRQRDGAWLN
jgi:hypothetical protein